MFERAPILKPVFVTGVGIVSPAGADTETSWRAIVANTRCVRSVTDPNVTGGGAECAGQVPGFVPPAGLENADRVCQIAVSAADQALASAGMSGAIGRTVDPAAMAISFGTSKGGILTFGEVFERYLALKSITKSFQEYNTTSGICLPSNPYSTNYRHSGTNSNGGVKALNRVSPPPLVLSDIPPDAPARHIAGRYGITGGIHATVGACATGTLAVIRAVQMVNDGQADVVLAGSADASLHPLWFAAFHRMRVLAKPHEKLGAGWACRPFDRYRGGFAIAEGAAVLVLESARSVRSRQAKPLARISGYAMGADPAGLTTVNPNGSPLAEVIRIACRRAAVDPARIAAVQAHGTGTLQNDLAEIKALRACGMCNSQIPISSCKGVVGHMLGAAGAVELAISILAVDCGLFPGNATLMYSDPEMTPTWLPTETISIAQGPILKTSLGFGGHLAAVIVEHP